MAMTKKICKRRRACAGGTLLLLLGWPAFTTDLSADDQPKKRLLNIVLLLADDMGWTAPACYGSDTHETPNIDRLAVQGIRFANAYAACAVCSPTRASVMTGKYPARLHLTDWVASTKDVFWDYDPDKAHRFEWRALQPVPKYPNK
jgi:hypothetical protein